ncbi:MAG: hypothetical protein MZV70_13195, partial [Desulfobacterales bacterium]|nr:hypothetical protein [Desulfobacterales bacterium]
LRKVLRADRAGLAESLLSPTSVDETERIDLAGQELSDPTVNLRSGPFDYTKDREKVRKKLRVTAILALVAAVLINGDLVLRTVTARQETSALNRKMRRFYTELFPKEKKITDEVYQLKSHLKEIGERGDALAGSPGPSLPDEYLEVQVRGRFRQRDHLRPRCRNGQGRGGLHGQRGDIQERPFRSAP